MLDDDYFAHRAPPTARDLRHARVLGVFVIVFSALVVFGSVQLFGGLLHRLFFRFFE